MAARLLPTAPTFAPGPLSSTQLTALATYMVFWANRPSFRAEQHTNQNVTSGVATQITCETTIHDSDGGLGLVTPYSYVVPFAGTWDFFGQAGCSFNATGYRTPELYQNGTVINGGQPVVAPTVTTVASPVAAVGIPCNVGDVISLWFTQTSGSTLVTPSVLSQCCWFAGTLQSLQTP